MRDKQFAQWWGDHQVAARTVATKTLNHPVVGELVLDWDTLTAHTDPRPEPHRLDCRTRLPHPRTAAHPRLLGRRPAPVRVTNACLTPRAATAGGLDFGLACDVRIAASTARFAESYVNLGMVPVA
jgi:hypothetical protein